MYTAAGHRFHTMRENTVERLVGLVRDNDGDAMNPFKHQCSPVEREREKCLDAARNASPTRTSMNLY